VFVVGVSRFWKIQVSSQVSWPTASVEWLLKHCRHNVSTKPLPSEGCFLGLQYSGFSIPALRCHVTVLFYMCWSKSDASSFYVKCVCIYIYIYIALQF
jgi:hypothetical protein